MIEDRDLGNGLSLPFIKDPANIVLLSIDGACCINTMFMRSYVGVVHTNLNHGARVLCGFRHLLNNKE